MTSSDRKLGMDRPISRRDFVQGMALTGLGLGLPGQVLGKGPPAGADYPPVRNGLRGSHPGSFEVAHALTQGMRWPDPEHTGESYELVVVGAGLSGLAAAHFYRNKHPDARILLLDNHDDFGGAARRNEFHQGPTMRLAWGGVFNLEFHEFGPVMHGLLDDLGVDLQKLLANDHFRYGHNGPKDPAIWFDAETYGRDVLVDGCALRYGHLDSLARKASEFPLDAESRASLKRFAELRRDITAGMDDEAIEQLLTGTSYYRFLIEHGGLTTAAADLFTKTTDGYWAVSTRGLSVAECRGAGLPVDHLLGKQPAGSTLGEDVAMFPDGNASLARLLVRRLIPRVAPGDGMDNIVTAPFDYARLDEANAATRLRLNATVVKVARSGDGVDIDYVSGGRAFRVVAGRCVLACPHRVIPYLCPQLPEEQKTAQAYLVRRPLLLTNVLLRSSRAADRLGITGAYCPGRMMAATWLVKGINARGYRHDWDDDGPVVMMFWGTLAPSSYDLGVKDQHRDSRARMLAMSFSDYEREVRRVLDGLLGPAGFHVRDDVLAITVNRWPHGYAYDYLDLWDPEWPTGQAPHVIARQPYGPIAIACSDAGADAYTHVAVQQAHRAIQDLEGSV